MPFADDLVVYVDAQSTALTAGTSLFKNSVPETTGRACFIVETRGQSAIEKFGGLPAMTRPQADVVVRSTKAVGGAGIASSTGTRSLAQDVWEILVQVANTSLNSKTYQRVTTLSDPYYMGTDEQGRALFGFQVSALRAATTN